MSQYSGAWWVAHTRSRNEKALAWHLQTKNVQYFLPMTWKVSKTHGRTIRSLLPLLPLAGRFSHRSLRHSMARGMASSRSHAAHSRSRCLGRRASAAGSGSFRFPARATGPARTARGRPDGGSMSAPVPSGSGRRSHRFSVVFCRAASVAIGPRRMTGATALSSLGPRHFASAIVAGVGADIISKPGDVRYSELLTSQFAL